MQKGNILIIENSALVRRWLRDILEKEFHLDIAKDKEEANQKIGLDYDLVICDLELFNPLPWNRSTPLVCLGSSHLPCETLPKPTFATKEEFGKKLLQKIDLLLKKRALRTKIHANTSQKYVLIGASTGGPKLIETIAKTLPASYPYPLCVVQHMPTTFTRTFAKRLDGISALQVVEASPTEEICKGKMIIAKGGKHLHFKKKENKIFCRLVPNFSHRFFVPSVDEMFLSAVEVLDPPNIMAVLLTGIGDDGADGMVALRKAGAYTIAESEKTATVYGMPKEAYLRGGATKVLPFDKIVEEILNFGR